MECLLSISDQIGWQLNFELLHHAQQRLWRSLIWSSNATACPPGCLSSLTARTSSQNRVKLHVGSWMIRCPSQDSKYEFTECKDTNRTLMVSQSQVRESMSSCSACSLEISYVYSVVDHKQDWIVSFGNDTLTLDLRLRWSDNDDGVPVADISRRRISRMDKIRRLVVKNSCSYFRGYHWQAHRSPFYIM